MRWHALARRGRRMEAALYRLLGRLAAPEIVFIGDSLTQFWADEDPRLFRPGRIGAGRAGETAAIMLARFDAAVVARRPRAVHIMGGTNDLWFGAPGERGRATLAALAAMAERARAAGIAVILAPPPPLGRAAPPLMAHPDLLPLLRSSLRHLAAAEGHGFVDYRSALADPDGILHDRFTTDGIHLTHAGYRAMRRPAEAAIAAALARA